jgi:hypothetical protein
MPRVGESVPIVRPAAVTIRARATIDAVSKRILMVLRVVGVEEVWKRAI